MLASTFELFKHATAPGHDGGMYEIVDNFRPVQELHGRRVLRNQMSDDENNNNANTTPSTEDKPPRKSSAGSKFATPRTGQAEPRTIFSALLLVVSLIAVTIVIA